MISTYKTVDVEYVGTTEGPIRRLRFRINGQDEWLDMNTRKQNKSYDSDGAIDYPANQADEALVQDLERLFNKVLAQ